MTQLALKPGNEYSSGAESKTPVGKNELTGTPLRIKTTNVFSSPALFILEQQQITVIQGKKRTSYLATKRNLLWATIAYTIVLVVVLSLLL